MQGRVKVGLLVCMENNTTINNNTRMKFHILTSVKLLLFTLSGRKGAKRGNIKNLSWDVIMVRVE